MKISIKKQKKGFTLIELLIVITIIGILAAALLPSILSAPARARDAARKAHINSIIAAMESYNSDKQHYPSDQFCVSTDTTILNTYFQGSKPPLDPQNKGPITTCTGYYYCRLDGNPANYMISAYMEIENDGNAAAAGLLDAASGHCPAAGGPGSDLPAALPARTATDHVFVVVK